MEGFDVKDLPMPPSGAESCTQSLIDYFMDYRSSSSVEEACSYSPSPFTSYKERMRNVLLTSFAQLHKSCLVAESMSLTVNKDIGKSQLISPGNITRLIQSSNVSRIVQLAITEGLGGHANALIWDLSQKTVHIFEPNGSSPSWRIATGIEKVLKDLKHSNDEMSKFKVIPPRGYCPRIFGQSIAQTSNCMNWSLLMCVVAIHCRQSPIGESIDAIERLGNGPDGKLLLRKLTHNFSAWLMDYARVARLEDFARTSELLVMVRSLYKNPTYTVAFSGGIVWPQPLPVPVTKPSNQSYLTILAKQRSALAKFSEQRRVVYETCRLAEIRFAIHASLSMLEDSLEDDKDKFLDMYGTATKEMITEWDPDKLRQLKNEMCKSKY